MFNFTFRGGVVKPSEHVTEKFLLFFLVGESEVPFYQMIKEGLATRVEAGEEVFVTKHPVCKLFVARQGFGIPKQNHSFFIMLDADNPTIEIRPFSDKSTGLYFRAKSRMMQRKEVLETLPEMNESRKFFERQEVLPLNLQQKMISVDRTQLRADVRHVKIGGTRKEGTK